MSKARRLWILAMLGLVALALVPKAAYRGVAASSSSSAGPVEATDGAWWSAVQAGIATQEYEISSAGGALQAPNRAQNFRAWFRNDGVTIEPRTAPGAWRWSWQTVSLGRGDVLAPVPRSTPHARGARVEYARGEVVEWYENRTEGLEQGFTLSSRPVGRGAVRIVGSIGGAGHGLRHRQEEDALVCSLGDGAAVVRYGGLRVVDAVGRELPSRMAAHESTLEIAYDDDGASYPVTVDPLVTTPAWTYAGVAVNDEVGYSVATAGDVNGDGLSDVIVGAPLYTNAAGVPSGRVFVFIGRPTGPAAVAEWYATPTGAAGTGGFGMSVASAGDVNGDGFDDVVVGAPLIGDDNNDSQGMVFVWHGGPSGGVNGASGLGATGSFANADWRAQSEQTQGDLGRSVATAGDVNGDGFADLIVGSPGYRSGGAQLDEGWAFLWLGSAGGLGAFGTPANADWSAQADFAGAALGWSVSTAGDVNADGYDDVLLGAPGANGAFLWLGSAADLGADGIPFNADWSANGTQAGAWLGESVCTAGDVDGDGYADVAIGAPQYDDPEAAEGKVFVWMGGPADLGANGNPVNADWSAAGNTAGAQFGRCVAPAGDVDGDGFAELIVGAPLFTNDLASEGCAWVFRGSGAGLEAVAFWSREGNQDGAQFGRSVATAGDVNGDGFADVLVGAPLRDGAVADAGWAGLYTGSAQGPATSISWFQEGNLADARFGSCVASAGDVNGDGYSDVLVGAPNYDGGQAGEGRVYLFPGLPTGLSINASWRAEVNQAGAAFGSAVSTAGDLNGDGYSDVLIGAPSYDTQGGADAGAFFVWYGSLLGMGANGTQNNSDGGVEEQQAGAAFGTSVAWLGDVNGDCFSDVAVGAPLYRAAAVDEGLVMVLYGGLSGIRVERSWRQTGGQDGCNFGAAIAGAGDVNGDNYNDMIVGAPRYDGPDVDEGRAGVLLGAAAGFSHTFAWYDESDQAGAMFGAAVAGAGDVDGDGYSDVLVGAPAWENPVATLSEGNVSLYRGSNTGLGAAPAWTAEADVVGARLGTSVATAGDVNGDGFSDVLLGAPGIAVNHGRAYLWLGSATGLGAAGRPANADWAHYGSEGVVDEQFGQTVASAGDVDGDGFSDIIVGAPYADGDLIREGRAFVYYGNASHGNDRAAQQRRHDDASPVQALGYCGSDSQLRLRALGRSAGGRARVKLECEFRRGPGSWLPGGLGTVTPWQDTGAPGARGSVVDLGGVLNLPGPGLYKWRSRVATSSPLFPHGPWLKLPDNALGEGDILLASAQLAVEPRTGDAFELSIRSAQPSRGPVRMAVELAAPARLSLDVFDVTGRRLRALAHGHAFEPGSYEFVWDGRTEAGAMTPSGRYFARLSDGSKSVAVRITRLN